MPVAIGRIVPRDVLRSDGSLPSLVESVYKTVDLAGMFRAHEKHLKSLGLDSPPGNFIT